MLFKKNERKKFPLCAALVVGGLAVVGACSIKNRGKAVCSAMSCKMKKMFSGKSKDELSLTECE